MVPVAANRSAYWAGGSKNARQRSGHQRAVDPDSERFPISVFSPTTEELVAADAAAAREQEVRGFGVRHMQAVWHARTEGQVACQTHARRAEEEAKAAAALEEEAKAAAALEQQKKMLGLKQRQDAVNAKAQRQAQQAAREQKAQIRACLDGVRRRRAVRLRRAAVETITEAHKDLRYLSFPCIAYLQELWRKGKVASRGGE